MGVILFPSFVKPEPLVGISANHLLDGIGYKLSVGLDVGAQMAGPFKADRLFDMDG